jgi:hypothetical protein
MTLIFALFVGGGLLLTASVGGLAMQLGRAQFHVTCLHQQVAQYENAVIAYQAAENLRRQNEPRAADAAQSTADWRVEVARGRCVAVDIHV